jgi:hypothetical protein
MDASLQPRLRRQRHPIPYCGKLLGLHRVLQELRHCLCRDLINSRPRYRRPALLHQIRHEPVDPSGVHGAQCRSRKRPVDFQRSCRALDQRMFRERRFVLERQHARLRDRRPDAIRVGQRSSVSILPIQLTTISNTQPKKSKLTPHPAT